MDVYVYTIEGLTRVYKTLARAIEQLLEDEGFDNLKQYIDDARYRGCWVDWDGEHLSVDDGGPEIKKVEYIS